MLTDEQVEGVLPAMRPRHGRGDDDEAIVIAGVMYLEQEHGLGRYDAIEEVRQAAMDEFG